jgi:preprotein translocase subunit SecG
MGFVIGFLTLLMVVDCFVLCLLVLVQLPKKEAGAGLAFGGSASDALFGAGSGTVLTKITKYAAGFFFALALLLGIIQSHTVSTSTNTFQQNLEHPSATQPAALPHPQTPAPGAAGPLTGTNAGAPNVESTNVPVIPLPPPTAPAATNAAAGTNAGPGK